MNDTNNSEGAEWKREVDRLMWKEFDKHERVPYYRPDEVIAFIAHQRHQAYTQGRADEAKTCTGCKENRDKAIAEAVAEFAREVVDMLEDTASRKDPRYYPSTQRQRREGIIQGMTKSVNVIRAIVKERDRELLQIVRDRLPYEPHVEHDYDGMIDTIAKERGIEL